MIDYYEIERWKLTAPNTRLVVDGRSRRVAKITPGCTPSGGLKVGKYNPSSGCQEVLDEEGRVVGNTRIAP